MAKHSLSRGRCFYESDFWKRERCRVLMLRGDGGGTCERCGWGSRSPHVHHRFGWDRRDPWRPLPLDHYEVLCPDCHAKHHRRPELAQPGRRGRR